MNRFLAGVGKALLFKGNSLIGVANTLTDSTFEFSISAEEIRGGKANALWGKYFHDSVLNVTLTDAMFNLDYIAMSLGVNVESGGIILGEDQCVVQAEEIELRNNLGGNEHVVWYKKPTDENWTIGYVQRYRFVEIPGAADGDVYCVKYFMQGDGTCVTIPTEYVPSELHVMLIYDLFNGDISTSSVDTVKIGRLFVDIPRLQLDGSQNLSLNASGAATTSLSGSALAVSDADSCDETYYGTITEELFGYSWRDTVIALATPDSDLVLNSNTSFTLTVYTVSRGQTASFLRSNYNFNFVVKEGTSATVNSSGVVTATSTTGETIIEISLKSTAQTDYSDVPPTYVCVTVE